MRTRRELYIATLALVALLLPTGCATESGGKPRSTDAAQGALSGNVGGVNLGSSKAKDAFGEVSEQQEVAMGKSIAAGLLGAAPLEAEAAQQRYLNSVGAWLSIYCGRPDLPWHFGIIEAEQINAFATPGGNVFITRGFLARLKSESELAGVLAHEMAHVVKKHQLNDIRKNAQKELALDLAQLRDGGFAGEAARAFARAGLDVYVRGLSREDELEADAVGVVIATRAGYEPYGLVSVLLTLRSIAQTNPDMALFRKTHPSAEDRLAALEAKLPARFETLAKPNPALIRYYQTFRTASATK